MNLPSLFSNRSNDPFRQLLQMQKQMDQLFEDFRGQPASFGQGYLPSCDVKESGDHFVISMDIPGMKKDDIKIELNDDQLTVSGERKEEKEEKEKGGLRSERFYGSFFRSFALPAGIKAEDISTDYKDGVLRIALPKTGASAKTRQIKVGEGKPGLFERLMGPKEGKAENKPEDKSGKVA